MELLTIQEVCDKFKVTQKTLHAWDKSGKLPAIRTAGNHRRYRPSDIAEMIKFGRVLPQKDTRTVIYMGVERTDTIETRIAHEMKLEALEILCKKRRRVVTDRFIEGVPIIGGARPRLRALIGLIVNREVSRIILDEDDKLSCTLFKDFADLFQYFAIAVEILSPEVMTEDIKKEQEKAKLKEKEVPARTGLRKLGPDWVPE